MSAAVVQTGTIQTRIPSRLDRLLDGLEVTMVGSVASRLTQHGSGISLTVGDIGVAAAIYVAGACIGALFFGQLCDRFGRKKLFIITLGIYIASTVVTAFSFAPWFFFLARFFTGSGIGGEYSAINSAIDELIPARVRGRADLIINGSYWLGSIAGSGAALFFLSAIFPKDLGWRLAFGVGAVLGLAVMFVRRSVPESPRWLFIHGREEEAEQIVGGIEHDIEARTGQGLSEVDKSITVRQRQTVPFREIARVAFKMYPRRSILCLALFVGQAFLYNGITFNLGTLMTTFFGVGAAIVPVFLIIYAVGNFAGPVLLGRLFDTIGRKPMISGTYLGSAVLSVVLAALFFSGILGSVSFIIVIVAVFFLASSGASAAYLTASEIFPMETRALAIAFFYALGTAVGGIIGPLLFGNLIATGHVGPVAIAFLIGAVVMALGGVAELFFGVKAAGMQLEDVARPLTAADAGNTGTGAGAGPEDTTELSPDRAMAGRHREQGDEERARAAEHRATAHEQLALAAAGQDEDAEERARVERLLAGMAEIAALAHDERAAAHDELADAEAASDGHLALAARERAAAAEERARARDQEAEALASAPGADAGRHRSLAAAAGERARSREQKALAQQFRSAAGPGSGGQPGADGARADMHELWAQVHAQRAHEHEARAGHDPAGEAAAARAADVLAEQARAAEERVSAAEHRADADDERREGVTAEQSIRQHDEAAARQADEERARARIERRLEREHTGLRRYRPGPGRISASPGIAVSAPVAPPDLGNEIQAIENALGEHGATERRELAQMVGARYWGPGVFREALREAMADGTVRKPPDQPTRRPPPAKTARPARQAKTGDRSAGSRRPAPGKKDRGPAGAVHLREQRSARMGQIAVITGASAGVGRATARAFAERGFDVALLARGQAGLDGAAKEVQEAGGRALVIPADVSKFDQVEAAATRVEAELGPIDVWVNDAMTTVFAPAWEVKPADFQRAVEVTFLGQVWGTMAALSKMRPRDRGQIVNIGSALAFIGIPLQSAYCSSKFACRGFFESTRAELIHEKSHIRMSMVHLPAVNTPQFDWCQSVFENHPQPAPPIYQPEIPARFILEVALDGRRDKVIGSWNKILVAAARIAPGLGNQYAAIGAWESQLTSQKVRPGRPSNLYEPADADTDHGAHGEFDHDAHGFFTPSFLRSLPKTAVTFYRAAAATIEEKKRRR